MKHADAPSGEKSARLVLRLQPDRKEKPTKVIVNALLGQESAPSQALGEKSVTLIALEDQAVKPFSFKFGKAENAQDFRRSAQTLADSSKSFFASESPGASNDSNEEKD